MKKKDFLIWIIIGVLLISVTGGTFAYFTAQIGKGAEANINASSGTTDSLMFNNTNSSISITANQDNFGITNGSLKAEATVTATLRPNNTTGQATKNYNVFLIIENNNLEYTQNTDTPELLVKISKKTNEGEEYTEYKIKEPTDLVYKEKVIDRASQTYSGYDITTKESKVYKIATETITAKDNKAQIDTWKIEVILVNLKDDQSNNAGKSLKGRIYITNEEEINLPKINTITTSSTTDSITVTVNGTESIYYYKIEETGKENNLVQRLASTVPAGYEQDGNTHTFNGLDENKNYKISIVTKNEEGYESNIYETIQKADGYELPIISSVTSTATADNITVEVTANNKEIANYYYRIDGKEWIEDTSNTHIFYRLADNIKHRIEVEVKDNEGRYSNSYILEVSTNKLYTLKDVCPDGGKLTDCLIKLNQEHPDYEDTRLIKHSSESEDEMVRDYGIGNDDLRYSGDNPNNFVCFGPGAEEYSKGISETCPVENLYRIIGLVDVQTETETTKLVKLIQREYATKEQLGNDTPGNNYNFDNQFLNLARIQKTKPDYGFYWNKDAFADGNYNYWETNEKEATLNNGLNDTKKGYLHYLDNSQMEDVSKGINWTNKIETVKWNIAGGTDNELYKAIPKTAYTNEMNIEKDTEGTHKALKITSITKIGLIYLHDYGFASDKSNWNTIIYNYNKIENIKNNWLFNGVYEWTISRYSNDIYDVMSIAFNGHVNYNYVHQVVLAVRPTFYLNSEEIYNGGNGSALTPYKIAID